jgi:hypothetical protein
MSDTRPSGAAIGFAAFAAIMLLVIGVFQVIAGITAIAKDETVIFANTADKSYWLHLDTTQWGWIHLILGIVIFLAGLGVLSGQIWARTVGVIIAGLAAIVNFAFIPIYPLWSILVIAICVAVIWALTAHGRDIAT